MAALVEISPPEWDVEVDLAYGHDDNFMGQAIYARPRCFLHLDAAACLTLAIGYAGEQGLRLKITDAFRPSEAQWALWNHTPDTTYVADPRGGSPHSRGVAVDVTLIDANGVECDMGGPVDDLTQNGHHDAKGISPAQRANRFLLLGIMTAAGFDWYVNEWWHYQLFVPRRYPVLTDRAAGTGMMG
ncbi:MAG: D-alanyl-D-alanine dipeptidase [Alphaproteobacteria bacterium]|jgi:zinc D-Ala-D-Ala dipeptidase|nr:D-alanyl-D-alanine dipeptidase [Rhodospirillaceae bacterium]MDG2482463.1 D-alanyl-D-alanine dipeptidase [Alphaproteobacteria bacterium]MBT6203320.1 D-alanyl-D-alanine dipeptidase [Rhodospirillaceae bacterium]MBT6510126.1 D-alanyl-D-alanine dipeptidase [Rhodospirillaceae bacterium]MBT7613101.1 D-alanyl-D-alanine dipeptidase [Rhodospirillaceae bacterium]